ncbi:MAG: GlsB/YeaQ/YmgE family stress response membrane protein, partial [Acidimicrobiales bacterium]
MLLALIVLLVILFVVFPLVGMAAWAIISTLIVGLIIGALGRLAVPGRQPIGLLATAVCGLCGSIVGGFLGDRVFYVGGLGTTLLEIAVAAIAVALFAGLGRRRLARGARGPG